MVKQAIVKDNVVVNIAVADEGWQPEEGFEAILIEDNLIGIGWAYSGGQFTEPAPVSDMSDEAFNAIQKQFRNEAYRDEADPLFFKWQRDEATHQDWLDKIEEIKNLFPYRGI